MSMHVIRGLIDRRILASYRVDPEFVSRLLPQPFRPQLVQGYAIAGVCLIRLRFVRPKLIPWNWGLGSENVAHRIAVEWQDRDQIRRGVYIHRRDTDSRISSWAGGVIFPGVQHLARFEVQESEQRVSVRYSSQDQQINGHVRGAVSSEFPAGSIFGSVAEAADFFRQGGMGYSPANTPGRFDGLELKCARLEVAPLHVEEIRSSLFEDQLLFPAGTIEFDNALLMRRVEHEWHRLPELKASQSVGCLC